MDTIIRDNLIKQPHLYMKNIWLLLSLG